MNIHCIHGIVSAKAWHIGRDLRLDIDGMYAVLQDEAIVQLERIIRTHATGIIDLSDEKRFRELTIQSTVDALHMRFYADGHARSVTLSPDGATTLLNLVSEVAMRTPCSEIEQEIRFLRSRQ